MTSLRVIGAFARASAQQELAYRANFGISLLHSLLNLATGILALVILFGQVESMQGWDFPSTLVLLGIYLTLGALRNLVIGPSLDGLAGLDGSIWKGTFDFTLLRPIHPQLIASFQRWRPLALLDLLLGFGVLWLAGRELGHAMSPAQALAFVLALAAGVTALYSVLLALASLIFWSPGFFFTWIFDGIFQMARYPVGIYPGWLRLVLTWIIPVGIMTTVPANVFRGAASWGMLAGSVAFAGVLLVGASVLFGAGIRRYESASS
jgi:ABC-2 type transport system permease protein